MNNNIELIPGELYEITSAFLYLEGTSFPPTYHAYWEEDCIEEWCLLNGSILLFLGTHTVDGSRHGLPVTFYKFLYKGTVYYFELSDDWLKPELKIIKQLK